MKEYIDTNRPEETEALGRRVGELAGAGLFVGLSGDLGAGKTVFVRGMARGLGYEGPVTSPTFQIVREYDAREKLFHFDFYRLGSIGEAVDLDIAECMETGIVAVEWSDRFPDLDRADFIDLSIEWTGDESRRITLDAAGHAGESIAKKLFG